MPLGSSSCQKWKWILLQLRTLCMCDSKANLWFITVMKGTSGMLWWYGVHYKKSITNAYRSRHVWICSESSLWPNSVVWKRYWDCTPEECLTATSIRPCLHPFLPFHPCPHPKAHSRTQVFIKAKGLTLKQSLPLILAWLLRPPISSQCAWYLSAAASPLIKTDIDRRMWISSAIVCLLKIIAVFSLDCENKRKLLKSSQGQRSRPSICLLIFVKVVYGRIALRSISLSRILLNAVHL